MNDEDTNDNNGKKKTKKERLQACRKIVVSYIPIIEWLPKYKFKEYFLRDLFGGLTLGCILVAQCLAFAFLSKSSPILGLQGSCFPLLLYCFLGTASISSYGCNVVTSMLTGDTVSNYQDSGYTNDQLIIVITFLSGIVYLIGYILRFSVITKLFTKQLISPFISAVSIQVIIKTLKNILGIVEEDKDQFYFQVIYNVYEIIKYIKQTNLVTLGLSLGVLTILTFNELLIKPLMEKWTKIIFPMEVVAIVGTILISYYLELQKMGVDLVGYIPTGFPEPVVPKFQAASFLWYETFELSLISYATGISVLMMYNPDMRPEQELFALSIINLMFSSFQMLPFSNSIVRTLVVASLRVPTLIANMVASLFMVVVILFLSPLFQPLPICVLACIIIFALLSLIVKNIKETPAIFKSGTENIIIWTITGLLTLFITIEIGLLIGLLLSLRQLLAAQRKLEQARQQQNIPPEPTQGQGTQPQEAKRR